MEAVDPTPVGIQLLAARAMFGTEIPLHEIADRIPWDSMPRFDGRITTAEEAHRRYHDELQERARQGDRYARSMLLGHAYTEPADAA